MIKAGEMALWPTPEGDVEVRVTKIEMDVAHVEWDDIFGNTKKVKAIVSVGKLKEIDP